MGRERWVAVSLAGLSALLVWVTGATPAAAQDVTVTAAAYPSVLVGTGPVRVVVTVDNPSASDLTATLVDVQSPVETQWVRPETNSMQVAAGASGQFLGEVTGRSQSGGTTLVEVATASAGTTTTHFAAITHPAAPALAEVAVTGDTTITNRDAMRLLATVRAGPIGQPLDVTLTGRVVGVPDPGRFTVTSIPPVDAPVDEATGDDGQDNVGCAVAESAWRADLRVPNGGHQQVEIIVHGHRLPPESGQVVISATSCAGDAREDVTVAHTFSSTPLSGSDGLSALGLSTLLLLPGVAFLACFSWWRSRWSRKRGVTRTWLPDIKNIGVLVLIVGLSAGISIGARALVGVDLLAGYDELTLLGVTGGATALAWLLGLAIYRWADRYRPALGPEATTDAVLDRMPTARLEIGSVGEERGFVLWEFDGSVCLAAGVEVKGNAPAERQATGDTKPKEAEEAEGAEADTNDADRPLTQEASSLNAELKTAKAAVKEDRKGSDRSLTLIWYKTEITRAAGAWTGPSAELRRGGEAEAFSRGP